MQPLKQKRIIANLHQVALTLILLTYSSAPQPRVGLRLMDYLSPHDSILSSAVHVVISQYIKVLVDLIPPS